MAAYGDMMKHMKNQVKKTMNEVKKKAFQDSKTYNKPIIDCNPGDWSDGWWKEACEYWGGKDHAHRSKVAAENRQKLKSLHSAGAKSFTELEDVKTCSVTITYILCICIHLAY